MYFSLRLWGYTKGLRLRIALAVAIGLFTAAAGIARLALLGWLLARVFEGRSFESLVGPLLGVVAVTGLRAVLQYFKEMVAHRTAAKVQFALRERLHDKVIELGPAYFDNKRTGDVTITLVEGVEQLETFFGQYLPQFFTAALTPVGLFIFVAFLDLPTASVYLGFSMLILVMPSMFHRRNARSSARRREAYGLFAADFLDSIQGLATLKAFGHSRARGDMLEKRAHEVFRSTMWVLASNAATHGVTIAGIAIGAAVALGIGAVRVNSGDMELQVLLIVLMLGIEVFRPLRELSQLFHQGLLGISGAHGVFQIMDAKPLVADVPVARHAIKDASLSIEFDGVEFSYPGGRQPALKGVSFKVEAGRRVGVVGRSGSGKTTLMWLLQRMYDPQHGRVLLGGYDVSELTFDQIRSRIAVVAQDTYLFHGTVAGNLRFGNPDATQADLERVARAANAHEFIARLPQGYDTLIGERGVRLSGGQRQRIAIARALLRDAPILVLDEALSSVDAENESIIQQALDRLMKGRTTLIMAHRLSSVINTDEILVLENGELVESGSHAELLGRGGAYARLMADQAFEGEAVTAAVMARPAAEPASASPSQDTEARWQAAAAQVAPTDAILRAEGMGWMAAFGSLLRLVAPQWPRLLGALSSGVSHFVGLIGVGVISALMVANVKNGEPIGGLMVALLLIAPPHLRVHLARVMDIARHGVPASVADAGRSLQKTR